MKIELEIPDSVSQAIADAVVARLRPLLAPSKREGEDAILTPDQLAGYLSIKKQRVYEAVSLKTIPYFKVGKSLRFRRSAIDKWIESQSIPVASTRAWPLGISK